MCLVAFAIHASARWPLVIASNRDEYFERPSLPLASWQTVGGQTIISGRDLRAGGSWLGMTPGGRIALLTNVRQVDMPPSPQSRGELVMRWLESELDANQFMAQTDSAAYGGFNLLLGDFQRDSWTWLSNRSFDGNGKGAAVDRPQSTGWCSRSLGPGVYSLSNAALDTSWPKTDALKTALTNALGELTEVPYAARLEASLWSALASRSRAGTDDLPDTGLPVAVEQALSSAFVDDPERGYGTRCSTLLLASAAGNLQPACWNVQMMEKTHLQRQARLPVAAGGVHTISHALQWQRQQR